METSTLGTFVIRAASVIRLAGPILSECLEALALDINQAFSAENPASAGFFVLLNFRGTLPVSKSSFYAIDTPPTT
jgi:hypothetical protein